MDKQHLLEEARKRYPVGTVYYNLSRVGERSMKDSTCTIPPMVNFSFCDTKSKDDEYMILVKDMYTNSLLGWVYSNKIWAEVKSSINNLYPIY